ncbi:transketolase, partial [Burkholderia multivorans]
THQPIEHLSALRAIPGLDVVRPADANETSVVWRKILERTDGPTGLVLTRQNVPVLDRTKYAPASEAARGGYVLHDTADDPQVAIIATGSEVQLALAAAEELQSRGIATR